MTAAENKRLVQAAFDGLASADGSAFVDLFADEATWTVTGSHKLSHRFEGKAAIERELMVPLFALFATPYRNTAERIIADEEGNVVVLAKGEVRTKSGHDYNNDYCFVFRMDQGKIVELREYMDSVLAERTLGELVSTEPMIAADEAQPALR
jgi:ketosteroid isomerase-like protein